MSCYALRRKTSTGIYGTLSNSTPIAKLPKIAKLVKDWRNFVNRYSQHTFLVNYARLYISILEFEHNLAGESILTDLRNLEKTLSISPILL